VARTKDGFTLKTVSEKLDTRRAVAQGAVRSSFYSAAHNAGLPSSLVWDLNKIFTWQINFKQGLHPGDTFEVLYEKKYFGDKFVEYGDILAAKFYVNGALFEAIRFKDQHGEIHYYNPQGESLDRAFLRVPVHYTHIGSSFNMARRHPILGITRPHEGVDLAANRGEIVKAAGNGVIAFEGKQGGYGNLIIINHGRGITTRYGHLSHFVKGLRPGDTVKMGQIIAYVGSTGLATGPHLHYEYRINEVPKNPLSVKLPGSDPLAAKYRKTFLAQSRVYLAQMDKAVSMPEQLTELS
jgi:murein DD-endopeptidase MepM/ murein hydrolase activator NlpD